MYELRTGDIMFIEDSVRPWRMYVDPILFSMKAVPEAVSKRIKDLEDAYKDKLFFYYREKKTEDETLYSNEIQSEFDEAWEKEHPEFFDMEKLFDGCSDEDLKNASALIAETNEVFRR